jgi:hypothetical protein
MYNICVDSTNEVLASNLNLAQVDTWWALNADHYLQVDVQLGLYVDTIIVCPKQI